MNEQTRKNGQQNLLKIAIQISVTLCLKAKSVPFTRSCLAEHMAKFKMSIWLNLSTFYKDFTKTNKNTKRKSQSQCDINIKSHREMIFSLVWKVLLRHNWAQYFTFLVKTPCKICFAICPSLSSKVQILPCTNHWLVNK